MVALFTKGHDVMDAKTVGQEQSLLAFPEVAHVSFLRIVASVPAGDEVSVNTLRPRLDAAEIPESARGGLFSKATKAGLLEPVWLGDDPTNPTTRSPKLTPSSGPTAHRAHVRVYRRTAAALTEVA